LQKPGNLFDLDMWVKKSGENYFLGENLAQIQT